MCGMYSMFNSSEIASNIQAKPFTARGYWLWFAYLYGFHMKLQICFNIAVLIH